MYFISKNSDSRFTWIHDFEENLTKSVRPVLFSAEYLIRRNVQTDRQTDELIRVGLGNLRFLQVNRGLSGKVDEEVGLMLGIIVSLWKMIWAVNEKW